MEIRIDVGRVDIDHDLIRAHQPIEVGTLREPVG
jgi:hypothetical protein